MSNFIMLAMCLVAGIVLRHAGRVPDSAAAAINSVIVHICLPALTLRHLHGFAFDASHLLAVLMPWLLFALGAVVFFVIGRALGLGRQTIGALTLVGGFGNTSFVGLPMIESLYGRAGLPLGLVIDQLGSYLALSTLGLIAATLYAAHQRTTAAQICRRVLVFPPFVAMMLALVLIPVPFPAPLEAALDRVGDALAPLALLSVGLQLRLGAIRVNLRALSLGLGYKLMICPALALMVLWSLGAQTGMTGQVIVIESAMPPMIGAGIVASQAKLDPGLVSLMIGLGIPIGFVTAPAWNWLYAFVA